MDRNSSRTRWILNRQPARGLAALLLLGASCSSGKPSPARLDPAKIASISVGHSSRGDVFAALGRPDHTQQGGLGEAWIYEPAVGHAGSSGLMSGAAAASGLVGAFVPYVGLVGSGLGLAGAAAGGGQAEPKSESLTIMFGVDGIVRDCTYSSTALPAGMPGATAAGAKVVDCQRPPPGSAARTP